MTRAAMASAAVCLALVAGVTVPANGGSPSTDLSHAWWSGDHANLWRAGFAAGASGLARAMAAADRDQVLAALAAAPAAEDKWAILDRIARLCASPDRPVAAAAARAAAAITADLDVARARWLDIPPPTLDRLAASYLAIAKDPRRWPDVRVLAVDTYAHIAAARGPRTNAAITEALLSLTSALEPEVRRVAMERLPLPLLPATAAKLAARIAVEPSDAVALVAAQVACGEIAFGAPAKTILGAMGEAGRRRLGRLITFQSLSISARLDAALCIAADHTKTSAAAYRTFRAGISATARRHFDIRRGKK